MKSLLPALLLFSVVSALLSPHRAAEKARGAQSSHHHRGASCSHGKRDPCEFIYSESDLYSYETVKACIEDVNLPENVQNNVLESLERLFRMHAFTDIHRDPPRSQYVDTQVDVMATLAALRRVPFKKAWPFFRALSSMTAQFHDGHTMFRGPTCMRASFAYPVGFGSRVSAGEGVQEIFLRNVLLRLAPDLVAWKGATVTHINGDVAMTWLRDWAVTNINRSKDIGTAFNQALKDPLFTASSGSQEIPPPFMELTLKRGNETMTVSVECVVSGTFVDDASDPENRTITTDACFGAVNQDKKVSRSATKRLPLFWREELVKLESRQLSRSQLKKRDEEDQVTAEIRELDGLQVATLKVTGFSWSENDRNTFSALFEAAASQNVTHLILDLTSNGGGSVAEQEELVYFLVGDVSAPCKKRYDMLHSEGSTVLARASKTGLQWDSKIKLRLDGTPFTGAEWYSQASPQYLRTRGGATSRYSQPYIPSSCGAFPPAAFPSPATPTFRFEKIIVLTDGSACSSAAVATYQMSQYPNVRTVVHGGLASWQQQTPFACPGGSVLDPETLVQLFEEAGFTSENSPFVPEIPMPGGASLDHIVVEELYPRGDDFSTPLEFLPRPANYVLRSWDFFQEVDLYALAATVFEPITWNNPMNPTT